MIGINIPGWGELRLSHLVLDYNGTIAEHGRLIPGVPEKLAALAPRLTIHILTADTFGTVREQVATLPAQLIVIPPGDQAQAKADYVRRLGADQTVAVGNGRNDRLMLKEAAVGIALVQAEGAAVEALLAADVAAPDILAALELLLTPAALIATLRS
jgi:soluble P-type ATPase